MRDGFLDEQEFEQAVRNTPLCAIDFVIRDPGDRVLLGMRAQEPAKGYYFAPGGRIRKGERIEDAFRRLLMAETSLDRDISDARALGIFEHFYEANVFGRAGFGTHYICLVYEIKCSSRPEVRGDFQHTELRWVSPAEHEQLNIHPYTLEYFEAVRSARAGSAT